MADLSLTATEVDSGADAVFGEGAAGEAITHGQPVYKKESDGKLYKADADASEEAARSVGIAVSESVGAKGRIIYQKGGKFTPGASASVTRGEIYYVSDTAGGIKPDGDLASGDFVTVLGVGDANGDIVMPPGGPFASGVSLA